VRHVSLWPFGTRSLRLFLLLDPRPAEPSLVRALVRAMQYEYFRWETGSQTRAVRSAVMAAHGVLRQHNRGMLSHAQASAAAVVAAARGPNVYLAMSGDVAAFSWSGGVLDGRHTASRAERPLGHEPEPPVSLWSAPFGPADRLVLICGADWHDEGQNEDVLREILSTTPTDQAATRIADALVTTNGAARVLVADGAAGLARRDSAARPRPTRRTRSYAGLVRRLVPAFLGLVLLSSVGASPFNPMAEPRNAALARQATALIQQAQESTDLLEAHALATTARDLADQVATSNPTDHAALVERSATVLDQIDRVTPVSPRLLVRLGEAGTDIVDLAVSADTLYTLDTAEGCIRGFKLDGSSLEQAATPETVVLRAGSLVGGRPLEAPVAIEYVRGPGGGALTVVDRARRVIQLKDGSASVRPLSSSRAWQQLAGLASDGQGNLYVLDQQPDHLQLLLYPGAGTRLADPPRVLIGPQAGLPDTASELLPLRDLFVIRDDGSVARYDRLGNPLPFEPVTPDGPLGRVASAAPDGSGGLFLADPDQARIIQTAEDGSFVRQLHADDLAGVRSLHLSPDGGVLYGLGRDGILAIDLS
jgi:hypothetical protein